MAIRKAAAYSKKKVVPYTRISKVKSKSYIKTIPQRKVVKFIMGNESFFREGKFPHKLTLVAEERAQIRDNALEACRQYINKKLDKEFSGQYLFKIITVPHHIQRENKMLTGAGADRMQTGMQLAFGKTLVRAAIVNPGNEIFFIAVPHQKAVQFVRTIFNDIKSKLPCRTKVIYEEIK